jgi:ABC-type antimicrobial peptide transport system permease subunit
LETFNSVENTYLRIFFLLGCLGMLIGVIGLMVTLSKSMLERQPEIALFMAVGHSHTTIVKSYVAEFGLLFIVGVGIGLLSAVLATLPSFVSGTGNISIQFLVFVLLFLIANGLGWIFYITTRLTKRISLLQTLRNE